MPERHWIIAYNHLTDEYRCMRWVEEWLDFKYCAMEDIQPAWTQKGLYESEQEAAQAYILFLNK